MKTLIIKSIKWVASSFDTHSHGASSRKFTAFAIMCCIIFLHWNYVTKDNAYDFLIADMAVLLLIFGIIKVDDLISLRSGVIKKSIEIKQEETISTEK